MIRRFLPKGQSVSTLSHRQVQRIQNWMNDYPRKILNYQTPYEVFIKNFRQVRQELTAVNA